jgi:hypothetical protein
VTGREPQFSSSTLQEDVVNEARDLLHSLDKARQYHAEHKNKDTVSRIDFAIGATLSLRTTVRNYDKAVRREPTV